MSQPAFRTGLATLIASGSAPLIILHSMTMKRRVPFRQFHRYPPVYSLRVVAYLGLADNSRGPLLNRLRGFSPPVVRSQNGLSAPYAALLSCLSTHRSCLLTYRSRAVGRSFSWFICNPTWGCGQGGTR